MITTFPIDIYVESRLSGLSRMRSDETPIILVAEDAPENYFTRFELFDKSDSYLSQRKR
jgi:hypothetical protein